MQTEFIAEVNRIYDNKLREACLDMVEVIPKYFWHIPASSSGKYHPACDLGDGGLVRHSIMVTRVAEDLIKAGIFVKCTQKNLDMAKVATLFHDCFKSGYESVDGKYSDHTEFCHPIYASSFVRKKLLAYDVPKKIIDKICSAISSHMGKWNTSDYEPLVALPTPETDFEKLIHTADYIASRKYIGSLTEWGEKE